MVTIAGGLTLGFTSGASAAPGGHDTHTDPEPSNSSGDSSTNSEKSGGDERAAEASEVARQSQAQVTFEVVSVTPFEVTPAASTDALPVEVEIENKHTELGSLHSLNGTRGPGTYVTQDSFGTQEVVITNGGNVASLTVMPGDGTRVQVNIGTDGNPFNYRELPSFDDMDTENGGGPQVTWNTNLVSDQLAGDDENEKVAQPSNDDSSVPPNTGENFTFESLETNSIGSGIIEIPAAGQDPNRSGSPQVTWSITSVDEPAPADQDQDQAVALAPGVYFEWDDELGTIVKILVGHDESITSRWTDPTNGQQRETRTAPVLPAEDLQIDELQIDELQVEANTVTAKTGEPVVTSNGGSIASSGSTELTSAGSGVDSSTSKPDIPRAMKGVCTDTGMINDGWGWDGTRSCRLTVLIETATANANESNESTAANCSDTDGDGWGWTGSESCRMSDQ